MFMHSSCANLSENCNATYIVLTKEKKRFADSFKGFKNRLKCLILQRFQRLKKMITKVGTSLIFEKTFLR